MSAMGYTMDGRVMHHLSNSQGLFRAVCDNKFHNPVKIPIVERRQELAHVCFDAGPQFLYRRKRGEVSCAEAADLFAE